jgi:hypothetical protein
MSNRRTKILENIASMKDEVLLLFDEHDAEIARNWRHAVKPSDVRDEAERFS